MSDTREWVAVTPPHACDSGTVAGPCTVCGASPLPAVIESRERLNVANAVETDAYLAWCAALAIAKVAHDAYNAAARETRKARAAFQTDCSAL